MMIQAGLGLAWVQFLMGPLRIVAPGCDGRWLMIVGDEEESQQVMLVR